VFQCMLQYFAVCCSVLQCQFYSVWNDLIELQCVAVCIAVCRSMLQCVAVSVLQRME